MRGLLGEPELEPDVALVLAPASQVHTFFMSHPLDVALCDAEFRVLWVRRAMPPNRFSAIRRRARFAIEMRAGAMPGWVEPDVRLLVVE
jgi:uncharacterized membrane protein (UPF0127 family)